MTNPTKAEEADKTKAIEHLKAKLREITKECVARLNKALGNDKPWRKIG